MRILDVSPRHTSTPRRGSAVRIHNLLRHLSATHEIRQFSQVETVPWPRGLARDVGITSSYVEHQFHNAIAGMIVRCGERSWVRAPVLTGATLRVARPSLLREWLGWAEVVLVEFPWQFEYCRRARPDAPLVLAAHNVESLKFRSYAEAQGVRTNGPWLRYIDRMERNAVARARLTLAVSEEDRRDFIRLYGADPDRIIEIPNGADTRAYAPVSREWKAALKRQLGVPEKPLVIYIGSNVPPNAVGLEWVRRLAAAEKQFTFAVIGPLFRQPERNDNLIATGTIDNYAEWLQASDISLCPIEYGGGTKIKMLEAMAAGLPVVAFEESLHGTALIPGRHLLVAPKTDDGLRKAVHYLTGAPDAAERLGEAARAFVVEHYDWQAIAERLERALLQLVPDNRSSSGQNLAHSARTRA